jgi:hypothetical protein
MAKLDIQKHRVTSTQEYFIDTSVWLLLYGNLGTYNKDDQRFYAAILGELFAKNSAIIITAQVISEISNVLLKKAFKDWITENHLDKNTVHYKRDFIGTDSHLVAIDFISNVIDNILKLNNLLKLPDNFNAIDMNRIMDRFKSIDFNDSYYIQMLLDRREPPIILTNDRDFNLVAQHIDLYKNK